MCIWHKKGRLLSRKSVKGYKVLRAKPGTTELRSPDMDSLWVNGEMSAQRAPVVEVNGFHDTVGVYAFKRKRGARRYASIAMAGKMVIVRVRLSGAIVYHDGSGEYKRIAKNPGYRAEHAKII
jgi:hypothetical protein